MGSLKDFVDFIKTTGPGSDNQPADDDNAQAANDASPDNSSSTTDNTAPADNAPAANSAPPAVSSLTDDNTPSPSDAPPDLSMADLVQLASNKPDSPNQFEWQQCFQAALQGTTGQGGMSDKQKVDLAAQIASASTKHLFQENRLGNVFDCCRGKATTTEMANQFGAFLAFKGHWGDSFLAALQTTSGNTKKPADAVKRAQGIADAAMTTVLDDDAMAIFNDCAKANP